MKIILASKSPRRRELLAHMQVDFEAITSNFAERLDDTRSPETVATELALGKALDVAEKYPDALVIGSDTIVTIDGKQLEKARDQQEAHDMLKLLAGKTNLVSTGVAIVRKSDGLQITGVDTTRVMFKPYDEAAVKTYLVTKDWADKAGGYGIQSGAAPLIKEISGHYDTVVGLPTTLLSMMLETAGVVAKPIELTPPVPQNMQYARTKLFIKNREGKKLSVVVEGAPKPGRLAFVMHGLSGRKTEKHIRAMIEAFLENHYTVVSFDTSHTFGESEGTEDYPDATITNYYADLEDVIAWAKEQAWYSEPFVLCGHSLGSISVALFAEKYPERVKALAPISTVVSGHLNVDTYGRETLEKWKKDGIKIMYSRDGKIEKRLKWSHIEDRLKYDLLPKVDRLTMPVILIAGTKDIPTPPVHQQILFDKLPGKKEIHTIAGAEHTFVEPHERAELKKLLKTWIASLD